ncbi:MAG: T9SS type A sorting domain-containing protein [Bacteroidota bacterium]
MRHKILSCLATLLFFLPILAQDTHLKPGDIAIIAFQSDNNDQFAFLCLVDIAPTTQIQFSEKGWNASLPTPAFVSTTEGVHTWTAPNVTLARGTVVIISFNSLGTAPLANYGTVRSSAAAKLSTSGDELIAYQGTAVAPEFIYAFGSRPWINSGIPTSNQSWLPSTLINGFTARDFATENDNQYFKWIENADTKDSILAFIGNTKNWTRSNTRFSSLPNWHFQILTNYYLKAATNPIFLESWDTQPNGSGIAPLSFTTTGTVFHLINQTGSIVLTDNWTLDRLMIHENVSLSIKSYQLSITNMMDSSKGFIQGSDESALIIRGKSGPLRFENSNAILNKLILLSGASASLFNKLNIVSHHEIGSVNLGDSAQLNTNGFLILSSSEKGSSTLATMGKGAILTGLVEVQKYIPSGKRNFRFLGHPFANSISLNRLTTDIDITGKDGSLNGFTTTSTNNPSAFWYNPIAGDQNNNEVGWTAFTNTNGFNMNAWQPKQGIRINLRGSKGEGLNGQSYLPSPITLHLKDSLNTGNQVATLIKNAHNDGYNLIGNPFAAEIDMSKLQIGEKIIPNYYLWDPYLGNKGGYICYPFSNSIFLPSFAAFFAQTLDSSMGNQIQFPETCKLSNSKLIKVLGITNKTNNQLELLVEADSIIWDRALFIFKTNGTDSVDFFDAKKLMNPDFSLFSWSAEKVKLCIDTRSNLHATKIPLGLITTLSKTYQLKVNQIPEITGYDFFLIDKFAERKLLLKNGLSYAFVVDSLPLQKDSIRFEIQMTAKSIPVNSIEISKFSCQVFPNPAGNQFTLHIQSPKLLPLSITLYNSLGQPILNKDFDPAHQLQYSISMDKWSAGIYVLKISNKEEMMIQKIIKY